MEQNTQNKLPFSVIPHHTGISVSNLEESMEWFNRIFGFELEKQGEVKEAGFRFAFIKTDTYQIELFQCYEFKPMPEERKTPNLDLQTLGTKHMCLGVDSMEKFVAHCKANNVEIVMGPGQMIDENYNCFIHGPEDILIETLGPWN